MDRKKIIVGGVVFRHVKTRESSVNIFRSNDGDIFLRTGPEKIIHSELTSHKNLFAHGFPVPQIISEGEYSGRAYYTEKSLGDASLGDFFTADWNRNQEISNKNFDFLLSLSDKFARAQLQTMQEQKDTEGLYIGTYADILQNELPQLRAAILKAFDKARKQIDSLPFVITHGDFNPQNLFEQGIIDFGSTFDAPVGYDLVNNIYNTYNFPKQIGYEAKRKYEFSEKQIKEYFEKMDDIFESVGLPKLSKFKEDFIFLKNIWSTARMGRFPKLQKWRYKRFSKILDGYLSNRSIKKFFVE